QQLRLFADHLLLLIHHRQTKGSRDVRTDAESKIVAGTTARWKNEGGFAQPYHDLSTRDRKGLPRPDIERDALPAPGVHVQLQSGEGFDFGIRGYAVFLPVTTKLTANKILFLQRPNRFRAFTFFV